MKWAPCIHACILFELVCAKCSTVHARVYACMRKCNRVSVCVSACTNVFVVRELSGTTCIHARINPSLQYSKHACMHACMICINVFFVHELVNYE